MLFKKQVFYSKEHFTIPISQDFKRHRFFFYTLYCRQQSIYSTLLSCIVLLSICSTLIYCTVLYSTVLYCTVHNQQSTLLYYTVLHDYKYTVLILLYCTHINLQYGVLMFCTHINILPYCTCINLEYCLYCTAHITIYSMVFYCTKKALICYHIKLLYCAEL